MTKMSGPKPWNADAKKPGALSSLDALLHWLQTPGNYRRWQAESKMSLAQEIANELEQQGIMNRSRMAIHHKIIRLEKQYKAASEWLKKGALFEQYHRGEAGEDVHRGVLQRCSLYLELTPVFQNSARYKEDSDGIVQNVNSRGTEGVDSAGELKPATLRNAPAKRSMDASATKSSFAKRAKAGATQPSEQINTADEFQALAGFHTVNESLWKENFGVEAVSLSKEAEEERAEKLHQRKMEYVDAIAKVAMDAEQKRQEMISQCAKVLARQKLHHGGLSDEEVDKIIPLPKLV